MMTDDQREQFDILLQAYDAAVAALHMAMRAPQPKDMVAVREAALVAALEANRAALALLRSLH